MLLVPENSPAHDGPATRPPATPDFDSLFDNVALGMVVSDTHGQILRANAAFGALVGRSPAELIGRNPAEFTHPDDIEMSHSALGAASITTFEKRYVRPDGSFVWARINIAPGCDPRTGPYLVGTAEDITEQKLIREELNETRRKVSSALIAGEVATYEWDVQGDRLWGDANFDAIFGTHRDADGTAPLSRFVETIHPDDREHVLAAIEKTLATGQEYETEYRVLNEKWMRWVSARGRIGADEPDGIVRFHGVVLDITERKRIEQELDRKTRLYNTFLSGTDDLAYLIDREGRFIFANRALLDLWGMTMEQVNGKTLYDLGYPKWHADMNMREFAEILRTKKRITGEVPYTSPTGVSGLFEYVFSPVLDEHGEVEVIAGTSRDATERRKAAELKRRLADQLQLALEAADMGWWQYDLTTGRVSWDERTRAIYGVASEDSSYADVLARIIPEDAATIDRAIERATDPENTVPYDVEYRLRTPAGGLRWIESRALCIFEGEGAQRRAVRLVGTALDVTASKLAQQSLQALLESERAARSEAEHANRMKDEFLATLSHELRTPLAAMLGWAQMLGLGGLSEEETRMGIGVIERNARVQAQIIDDLLEMSRVISGKVRLDVRPAELLEVVTAAIATVQNAADAKGVAVSLHAEGAGVRINGDMNRLQQVFWNLLSNAVKFTASGGRIEVSIMRDGSKVGVAVRDTGDGIDADFLPYVFDRFRQADASTTRRHGGLGLGLAIVKQLVELHGGSVSAESAGAGKGSTFHVTLPAATAIHPQEADAPRRLRLSAGIPADRCERIAGLRILLVDDENDSRRAMQHFLEDCDAVVAQASSAEEAYVLATTGRYDVLLSDIGMPLEDGYSLIGRLRAAGNAIPAIALTAYAHPEDRVRALGSGFSAHVSKPADFRELIDAVALSTGRA